MPHAQQALLWSSYISSWQNIVTLYIKNSFWQKAAKTFILTLILSEREHHQLHQLLGRRARFLRPHSPFLPTGETLNLCSWCLDFGSRQN